MTSSTHKGSVAQGGQPSPIFFQSLERAWFKKFFDTCEMLHIFKPYMDGEDLEEQAHETTIKYFYLKARDSLPFYRNDFEWVLEE